MVVVEILGGLGNQLDAYACGYSIAKQLGQELVLDVSDYTHKGYFRPYCLDKLKIGTHKKLIYPPVSPGFMDASCIPQELRDNGLRILKHEDFKTREALLDAAKGAENIYLMGYGGRHYCTQEDDVEVKKQFQLKEPSIAVEQFKERIRQEFSVAVHIRRTDYVALGCQAAVEYYQAAIVYLKIFYPDAHFYFFSDDIQYAKDQFGPCANYHYVHLLGGMDADLEEFFCISACDARILTRESSFSAWAMELSQSSGQLNICQEYERANCAHTNQLFLNRSAIDILSSHYQVENTDALQNGAPSVNDVVYHLVSEARNDEAICAIDLASIDSFGLSETDTQELTLFKAISLAQKGKDGLPAALRTLYRQMQTEYKNPVFHANYFQALYQSGLIEESAIHAALANRFGDQEDYQPYFAQMGPFGQKLYQLLRNAPVRHFVFIPMEGWSFYITYVKSLAAILARMGQKVSFFQPINTVIKGNPSDAEAATALLNQSNAADSVYQYHVDLVPFCSDYGRGRGNTLFYELTRQCVGRFDMPAIVVTSHPDVFTCQKVAGVKYVVPDIVDSLNQERLILENSGIQAEAYVSYMLKYADAVFLSEPVFTQVKKQFGQKIHQAYPTWEGPSYQILEMETDITPNYIASAQMIRNAAALLEI